MATYTRVPIVPLETERLRLRPLKESDAPAIQRQFADPDVVRYLTSAVPWPYPDDGAETFLRGVLPGIAAEDEYAWAILRKGHESEGLVGIIHLTPGAEEANRGFWLARTFWGRGLMSEAVAAVNDFAFDVLKMPEMRLDNAVPNIGSHRLKENRGAELLGYEERDYVGGRFKTALWRLTAEGWRAARSRGQSKNSYRKV